MLKLLIRKSVILRYFSLHRLNIKIANLKGNVTIASTQFLWGINAGNANAKLIIAGIIPSQHTCNKDLTCASYFIITVWSRHLHFCGARAFPQNTTCASSEI